MDKMIPSSLLNDTSSMSDELSCVSYRVKILEHDSTNQWKQLCYGFCSITGKVTSFLMD